MAHVNPCPNPGIPPLRIEIWDIPVAETDEHYPPALKVFKAYWRQATNMTTIDQWEYKSLIEKEAFVGDYDADPLICHDLFTDFLISPTWAKYVFLQSLFGDDNLFAIERFLDEKFLSLRIDNHEREYRFYHRDSSLPDAEVSGEVQTQSVASSHSSLLNPGSTEQLSANCDQSNVSPLNQSSLTVNEALTQNDLVKLETRLRASIVEMEKRILKGVHELRTHVMASATNNDQMPAMLDEQTNPKKRKQNTVQ